MSPIDLIIFDCDGVILDSVNIKTNTFAELFSQYGEDIVKEVVDYHLANGGLSRYEKFKYYYKELLGLELTDSKMAELDQAFNDISFQAILQAPFISGAMAFIMQNYKKWPFFVASGAPEKELQEIFEKRGLSKFFQGIYGSPALKRDLVVKIVEASQIVAEHILMIGDSRSDEEAACFAETRFLAIGPNWSVEDCDDHMHDLVHLRAYVESIA